jgi:hypothetical protein
MRFAIRFAHGGPDTHRHTSEPVLLGHHFLHLGFCSLFSSFRFLVSGFSLPVAILLRNPGPANG